MTLEFMEKNPKMQILISPLSGLSVLRIPMFETSDCFSQIPV
jgi:hypothetical protein